MSALRTAPTAIRFILAALTLLLLVYAAELAVDFLGGDVSELFQKFATNTVFLGSAIVCAVRAFRRPGERAVWLLMGLGLLSWGLGALYYTLVQWNLSAVPFPSPADAGYLLWYPPTYTALVLLYRSRMRERSGVMWIDGAIGALAVGAVAAAIVFEAVLNSTGGSVVTVAMGLAYPLGDLVMLALVVGVLVMTGWRRAGSWAWIAGGLAVFSLADSLYLYGTAEGTYQAGVVYDAGWPLAALLVAYGAWTPASPLRTKARASRGAILLPISFALASLALLIYDHLVPTNGLAVALASLCLVAVLARLALTFGDNLRMLTASREEASTDALTGLGNRRSLTRDLERVASEASAERPACLAIFDLDGFKAYNDTYGHPAGDSLLVRVSKPLQEAVDTGGTAYRIGGDEFVVLTHPGAAEEDRLLAAAAAALGERGEGFTVTCSFGRVALPAEAGDAERALHLADERMYVQKNSSRASADRQSSDVLLRALSERNPSLGDHVRGVVELGVAVGERLALPPEELEDLRRAAELHDIGKVAIPDAILAKQDPLNDAEREYARHHTIIGERILQAAPALGSVARIVRSTHERMDGKGYPDHLAGAAIPLAARIVLVCDAFEATTTPRGYREAMSSEVAIEELERCAGAQFDPRVVSAFRVLADQRAALARR